MKTRQFTAATAAAALAQIHEQLGPNAVVLSVRPLPAQGMARLWHKNAGVEILAGIPDGNDATGPSGHSWRDATTEFSTGPIADPAAGTISGAARWRSVSWLKSMGLLSTPAERLQARLDAAHPTVPASLEDEWAAVSATLQSFWKPPPPLHDGLGSRPHVFIGPPGCGKTTVLCKWLTLAVLTEERSAQVWRLDGGSANTAEFLSIHCEMLGAPIERFWSPPHPGAGLLFIDLPGVEARDPHALAGLRKQLAALPSPRIHLVLNAAYESEALLNQWQAFSGLDAEDLTFTHLDEETRRVKLWNLVVDGHCGIRFLSGGQKIPGEFCTAAPEFFFPPETIG